MSQEAEQAVKRAQEACERLERDLVLHRNIEDSLRRDLAEAKANEARWAERIKALEERLARIGEIATGRP